MCLLVRDPNPPIPPQRDDYWFPKNNDFRCREGSVSKSKMCSYPDFDKYNPWPLLVPGFPHSAGQTISVRLVVVIVEKGYMGQQ